MRIALFALALLSAGCGGGSLAGTNAFGSSSTLESPAQPPVPTGRGGIVTKIAWPTKSSSRVIPTATQTIRVDVLQGTTVVASTLVTRPNSTATIADVPTGTFSIRARAYADLAGTSTPLAAATVPLVAVTDGTNTPVSMTMNSTVTTLTVSPASVSIVLSILTNRQLTVTAKDMDGNIVLIDPADLTYSSNHPLIAVVGATGLLNGLLPGAATITVRETTNGVTATVPVTIL